MTKQKKPPSVGWHKPHFIKEWREERGLNQTKLGKLIGITQSTLSKYERGEVQPDVEALHKISRALRVEVSQLIEGGPMQRDNAKELSALCERLSAADEHTYRMIVAAVKTMLDAAERSPGGG